MPLTGAEIVAELHEPATGVVRGRCGVRLTGGRCRGRRRGVHLAANRGPGTSVALDSQLGPRLLQPLLDLLLHLRRDVRTAERRAAGARLPRTARTTCWVPRCRPRRDRTTAGTCEPPRPSAGRRCHRMPRRAWSGRARPGHPGSRCAAAGRPHGSRSPCWRVIPPQPPCSHRLKPGQLRWERRARLRPPWQARPTGASCGCARAVPSAAAHACGVTSRASGSSTQA